MDFLWHLLFTIANLLPGALAYSFVLGRARILNWGPIGLALVSAYGIFLGLTYTGSYWWGALIGLAVVSVVSLFYAWLALRLPGEAFGVLSIAVHLSFLAVVLNWTSLTRGAMGISGIPRMSSLQTLPAFAIAMTIVALLWLALFLWIDKSAFGRQVTALGEQELHAASLGIPRVRIYVLVTLLLGWALWTGALFSPQYLHQLYPNEYQFSSFIFLITIVVAGRPGSIWGVTLSTILLTFLKEGLRFVSLPAGMLGPDRLILFGVILFGAVWYRRDILFPQRRAV